MPGVWVRPQDGPALHHSRRRARSRPLRRRGATHRRADRPGVRTGASCRRAPYGSHVPGREEPTLEPTIGSHKLRGRLTPFLVLLIPSSLTCKFATTGNLAGILWTIEIPLRIRRLGVRVPPSAPTEFASRVGFTESEQITTIFVDADARRGVSRLVALAGCSSRLSTVHIRGVEVHVGRTSVGDRNDDVIGGCRTGRNGSVGGHGRTTCECIRR